METRRWYNAGQPQTLQLSQILLYLNAATLLLFGLLAGGLALFSLVFIVGEFFGAFGIANSRKAGYRVGMVFALLALAFELIALPIVMSGFFNFSYIINLMFQIALVVALLHPQSREYQRIWFH